MKVDYFAAIDSRWGQPVGIGPVSEDETSRRGTSYVLYHQRGLLTGVKRRNGSGALAALAADDVESEIQNGDVAEIRVPFPSEHVSELDYYNAGGPLVAHREIHPGRRMAAPALPCPTPAAGAQALSVSRSGTGFGIDDGRRSQISQYGLTFDAEGRLIRRLYRSVWGAHRQRCVRKFRRAYTYTSGRPDRLLPRTRCEG